MTLSRQKFFAGILTTVVVCGTVFTPVLSFFISNSEIVKTAHAQSSVWNANNDFGNLDAPSYTQAPSNGNDVNVNVDPNQQDQNVNAPNSTDGQNTVDLNNTDNSSGSGDSNTPANANNINNSDQSGEIKCGTNLLCAIVVAYSDFTLFVPKLFANVAAVVLDYSLWSTLQSSTYTSQDATDSFVVRGWKLVRDLSNLLFIFALFVIAFVLILNKDEGGDSMFNAKRNIVRVIVMALLINFSFFMCRALIDVGNILGNQFYTKISSSAPTSSTTSSSSSGDPTDSASLGSTADFYQNIAGIRSVSLGILAQVNPQRLVISAGGVQKTTGWAAKLVGAETYTWSTYILLIFVSSMAGFFDYFLTYLFISSAIFLIVRTVGLFFFIILSPLAFVSVTIPKLQRTSYFGFDDWLKQFVGLVFCAPIYLFFMYLTILFLKAPLTVSNDPGLIVVSAVIAIKLAIVGALLIFGKRISKDLSGKLGAMASGAVTSIVVGAAMIGGAVATGGATAGLQTAGRLAANKATEVIGGGDTAKGQQRIDSIRSRMTGLKNFSNDPRQFRNTLTKGATLLSGGSAVPGKLNTAYGRGERYGQRIASGTQGSIVERAKAIQKARGDKARKVADIDKKLEEAKQKYNTAKTDAEKVVLKKQIEQLNQEKKNVLNPPITKQVPGTQPNTPVPANATANTTNQTTTTTNQTVNNGNTAAAAQTATSAGAAGAAALPIAAATVNATNLPGLKGPGPAGSLPVEVSGIRLAKNNFTGDVTFDRPKPSGVPKPPQTTTSSQLTELRNKRTALAKDYDTEWRKRNKEIEQLHSEGLSETIGQVAKNNMKEWDTHALKQIRDLDDQIATLEGKKPPKPPVTTNTETKSAGESYEDAFERFSSGNFEAVKAKPAEESYEDSFERMASGNFEGKKPADHASSLLEGISSVQIPNGAMGTQSLGEVADHAAALNKIPFLDKIPEVGPELKAAAEIGDLAHQAGITANSQSKTNTVTTPTGTWNVPRGTGVTKPRFETPKNLSKKDIAGITTTYSRVKMPPKE